MSDTAAKQNILILFAHPGQNHSKANLAMAKAAKQLENVTFVDLYADYPKLDINIKKEQQRLLEHDVIILQFPIFWYSTPSMLKEWQDLVLEYGFAYGQGGNALKDKKFILAVTAGGDQKAYSADGHNEYPLTDYLLPLKQTAKLCHMQYLPPFVLFGSLAAQTDGSIEKHVILYQELLTALVDNNLDYKKVTSRDFINNSPLPINGKAS
ncbi:MAG: NAD(P)H-dependent oxidoreductase [Rhizobiales bacterium]|nr:NAD(P)H-dependent oxidoreductase [Hyphomicrobiales bacterium]